MAVRTLPRRPVFDTVTNPSCRKGKCVAAKDVIDPLLRGTGWLYVEACAARQDTGIRLAVSGSWRSFHLMAGSGCRAIKVPHASDDVIKDAAHPGVPPAQIESVSAVLEVGKDGTRNTLRELPRQS